MKQTTALLLCLLPVLGLQAGGVSAQQILFDSPGVSGRPELSPATRAPAEPSRANERQWAAPAAEEADAEVRTRDVLLPLRPRSPQGGETAGHRMQGEYPEEGFWMFLPRALGEARLDLTTLSSINLLPGRSRATVLVNGTEVGTLELDNFSAAGTDGLDLPAGLLKAGRNLVELKLEQVHRVMCGPDASFGLWTDVIAHQSGITVPRSELGRDPLSFIAAAAAQLGQGSTFSLTNADNANVIGASPSVAKVEKLFGGLPPEILVEDYYTVSATNPQLARVTALPQQVTMPELPAFRIGGDGAIVLLTNSGEAEKIATLLTDALGPGETGTAPPLISPGASRTLASIGIPTVEGHGHYIRKSVSFRLPWDWLVLASQRAQMRLDYAFDTDLPKGSLLLVKINEQTIRLLPLDDVEDAGRRLDPLLITFAANQLQPGANEISFEALIPGEPSDAACVPRQAPAFQVFDSTSLNIPESPRMTVPRIDRTLAAVDVSRISMSEAAARTLPLGLLAQVASIYAPDETAQQVPGQPPRTGSIRIGIPADLSQIPGDIVSKNVLQLEEVLLSAPTPDGGGVDPWATLETESWLSILLDRRKAADRLRELKGKIAALGRGPESDLDSWLLGRSAEAMLIQPTMESPENLWLVVRPNTDTERLVASLVDMHRRSEGPKGQVSLFGYDGKWQVWRSANRPLTLHEPLTITNARAVVGNYVTLSPGRYIAPLFLLAFVCALSAMGLLIVSRRRKK
ncbi:cellulose biosynthesis cyclic di-GMP-binding regulatory protein BcsB [Oceanicola sp. S124]|uniref:cellulose biosynthesis cyclic di-GMP-binding regulatory protein BcsB n=1 Tax=Oceanicola sp. S124 TaxID=1042378 RepID=UPI0002559014|nr:cellulose biosynthesis cyclic di-GMP-binding regulatory protein BcsB [Oceanicola sp. S124]